VIFWLLGGLSGRNANDLPALLLPVALGLVVLLLLRWLDVMSLPEEAACAQLRRTTVARLAIVAALPSSPQPVLQRSRHCGLGGASSAAPGAFSGVGPSFVRLLPASCLGGGFLL
jgi:iron complex transport system permease protein